MKLKGTTHLPAGLALLALAWSLACGGSGSGGSTPAAGFTTLSVLAGFPSGQGNADGARASARFDLPLGVAVDPSGNILVADSSNDAIRRITPAGQVSTLAFKGATLTTPVAVAVNANGDIFVADEGSKQSPSNVYKISSATPQTLTPMAVPASGSYGDPRGVAVDKNGNLYVTDSGNEAVYMIAGGSATAVPAVLPSPAGGYVAPNGVTVDIRLNVYVADWSQQVVYRIPSGGGAATALPEPFVDPTAVAVDAGGNLFVMEGVGQEILLIPAAGGGEAVLAGSGSAGSADGAGTSASFNLAAHEGEMALVATATQTTLYLPDSQNNTIRALALTYPSTPGAAISANVSTLAGQAANPGHQDGPVASATFTDPLAVAVVPSGAMAGTAFVAEQGRSDIRTIVPPGNGGATGGTVATLQVSGGNLGPVTALAADGSGNLYVADTGSDVDVWRLSPPAGGTGAWLATSLLPAGILFYPSAMAVDSAGDVFVADSSRRAVYEIAAGSGTATELAPGVFTYPQGVAVDAAGNVYVADFFAQGVYQITPAGQVYTLAGGSGQEGSQDGPGPSALLNDPTAVVVAPGGMVYVADAGNNLVRQLSLTAGATPGAAPSVAVTTLVGVAGTSGTVPGALPGSLLAPSGIALNPDGTLLLTVPDAVMRVQ